VFPERHADILALDEALAEFGLLYPRQSHVVELRFFGGLEVAEVAEALKISAITVKRDWQLPKPGCCGLSRKRDRWILNW
jgi:DNA-directed RNA polymerase specialized sigma24 family protein